MKQCLADLLNEWDTWAANARKDEDGWESNFPRWQDLIDGAKSQMRSDVQDQDSLRLLERCWSISEEAEELASYTSANIDSCWPVVQALAHSTDPRVRWQAYEAAAAKGTDAEHLLRAGLSDPDNYARRRSLLSLARLRPQDAGELADKYCQDDDPYMRQATVELARLSGDPSLRRLVLARLRDDPVEHVRRAAAKELAPGGS